MARREALDIQYGNPLEGDAPISGMQSPGLRVIKDVPGYLGGDSVYRRMQTQSEIPSEVPSTLGTLGTQAMAELEAVEPAIHVRLN